MKKPIETRTIDLGIGVTLELVRIPGGKFLMGSPENEEGSFRDEGPQHEVTVPEFWMGKYSVTQDQYSAVIGKNPSHFKGKNLPVECVSWNDAVAFCERLSRHTGNAYRLPTEAEWEYAGRAGTTTRYYFGNNLSKEQANFNRNVGATTPVGTYPANKFGIYDMHGNVFEWCRDHWHDDYTDVPADGSAWLTNDDSASRVRRGGSWNSYPRFCRSAYRYFDYPDDRINAIGFRVVTN